jgi:hypothetical protein
MTKLLQHGRTLNHGKTIAAWQYYCRIFTKLQQHTVDKLLQHDQINDCNMANTFQHGKTIAAWTD